MEFEGMVVLCIITTTSVSNCREGRLSLSIVKIWREVKVHMVNALRQKFLGICVYCHNCDYTPGRGKIVPRNYTPGRGKIVPRNLNNVTSLPLSFQPQEVWATKLPPSISIWHYC